MRVAGVEIPPGSVARLAAILEGAREHDLAHRVGVAVDTNQPELALSEQDRALILMVLSEPHPDGLAPLYEALTRERPRRRFRFPWPRIGGSRMFGLG